MVWYNYNVIIIYGMAFIAQREEKEKNLKSFANNFFMDIIL